TERRRALRALGELADPAASGALRKVATGPRREEALLAGWALGRLPRGSDGLAARPHGRNAWILRAALAARGDPAVWAIVEALPPSGPERAFLLAGGFSPEQFEIAATLFRDGAASGQSF